MSKTEYWRALACELRRLGALAEAARAEDEGRREEARGARGIRATGCPLLPGWASPPNPPTKAEADGRTTRNPGHAAWKAADQRTSAQAPGGHMTTKRVGAHVTHGFSPKRCPNCEGTRLRTHWGEATERCWDCGWHERTNTDRPTATAKAQAREQAKIQVRQEREPMVRPRKTAQPTTLNRRAALAAWIANQRTI